MKQICVFCASNIGTQSIYEETAIELGKTLAQRNIGLVYGGGNVGLMGKMANAALEHGGTVVGVIPEILMVKEVGHLNVTKLHVVKNMHERKMLMHQLSDAVITMPGGFGTFEEYFEMLTWGQLGVHQKPIALLNVNGFYDHLIKFVDHAVNEGLLKSTFRNMMILSDNIEDILEKMKNYIPPSGNKWISEIDV